MNSPQNPHCLAVDFQRHFKFLKSARTCGHKNTCNTGADVDQSMELGILPHGSYCLHLLHAHYCAALSLLTTRRVPELFDRTLYIFLLVCLLLSLVRCISLSSISLPSFSVSHSLSSLVSLVKCLIVCLVLSVSPLLPLFSLAVSSSSSSFLFLFSEGVDLPLCLQCAQCLCSEALRACRTAHLFFLALPSFYLLTKTTCLSNLLPPLTFVVFLLSLPASLSGFALSSLSFVRHWCGFLVFH